MHESTAGSGLLHFFKRWLGGKSKGLPLGSSLPAITVQDEQGNPTSLPRDGWAFLYFYPRADTPGCTRQACSLRDAYEALMERNVRVFGASLDSAETQRRFREKHRLPFPLLADEEGKLADAFQVPRSFGFTRRQAFLFRDGILVWKDLDASTDQQAADALQALNQPAIPIG